ncbi:MAG: TusE/DsrC/DsvC family sulfur relay protein [Burkholderiaceae bacterium]|jgi:tRNA 2-thiouridine synthesizing protein E|nr:TusE/DsrC/DsvC family sulfur relay protein [Burkholderiaceae bacterium]
MIASHATPTLRPAIPGEHLASFDREGFLVDPEAWSRELAERIAAQSGVGVLGSRHWKVIELVRSRYFAIGALPVMRLVCRAAGLDPRQGHALFGSCAALWRIAGLPHPGDEALAYMH